MQVELFCPNCTCRFQAPPENDPGDIMQQITEDDTCYPLGDGETLEDLIFSALTAWRSIHCPLCDSTMSVSEESLGYLAMAMLSEW